MGRKPCCSKEEMNRGAWSLEEDEILRNYINTHGVGKWRVLSLKAGLNRCGKSCRLRWLNYLRPEIKRGNISKDEEDLIIRLHSLLGNRWTLIAGRLPGRTDNEIKNYWNANLAKRVSCQNSPSISARKRSKTLEEKKEIYDKVPNKNIPPIRPKPIHHSNLESHMNQDQGIHHRSSDGLNCNDTKTPDSIACRRHSGDPAIVYEDLERLMADDHDHGQSSSNNTNTILTPEIEASNVQFGGLQNTNLHDHFPRADNDQPFIINDDEDDPSKSIHSLPYSDLLIDSNGIEIKMVDKVDEEQEVNGEPNMEINLMLELKKMASFLEVGDEWDII